MKIIEITKEALQELLKDLGSEVVVGDDIKEVLKDLKEEETDKPS